MRVNFETVLTCGNVELRPYRLKDVPVYHAWMESEELREQTASERLTLEEEAEMQREWYSDCSKLTFIIWNDLKMCGDVNLFLNNVDDLRTCEISAMVALKSERGKGVASTAIKMIIEYASFVLGVNRFVAKIATCNASSARTFSRIGFELFKEVPEFDEAHYEFKASRKDVSTGAVWRLVDPLNESELELGAKKIGTSHFRCKRFEEALGAFSVAIRTKEESSSDEEDNPFPYSSASTLYANRAACWTGICEDDACWENRPAQCAECDAKKAVEINQSNAKAWYRLAEAIKFSRKSLWRQRDVYEKALACGALNPEGVEFVNKSLRRMSRKCKIEDLKTPIESASHLASVVLHHSNPCVRMTSLVRMWNAVGQPTRREILSRAAFKISGDMAARLVERATNPESRLEDLSSENFDERDFNAVPEHWLRWFRHADLKTRADVFQKTFESASMSERTAMTRDLFHITSI